MFEYVNKSEIKIRTTARDMGAKYNRTPVAKYNRTPVAKYNRTPVFNDQYPQFTASRKKMEN
jgi:hypothetical protein